MAAIRMLFSWLTEKGVLAMNPAREVKTEKFSRTEGDIRAYSAISLRLSSFEPSSLDGAFSISLNPAAQLRIDRSSRSYSF
jgi:hypothetical protein